MSDFAGGQPIRILGGRIVDPTAGPPRHADLYVRDGRILRSADASAAESMRSAPETSNPVDLSGASAGPMIDQPADSEYLTIDACGCDLIAGGIDLHTHIGGGKLSIARMLLQPEICGNQSTPADSSFLPSPAIAARRYLDMGYTTCFEPAIIPTNARSAHLEMSAAEGIDTGGYCLLGNDDALLSMIADGLDQRIINDYVAVMVAATGCIAVKVVNPGGINAFKFNARSLDVNDRHPRYEITPAQVIRVLCRAVHEIGLRHPLHVHASNLGVPGNIKSTLATIEAADGLPIHLTHVQFHSYTKTDAGMGSAAAAIAKALAANPNVTVDVGQVMFGQTVTISADSMHQFEHFKHADPRKSVIVDVDCQAGCGVVPFRYRKKRFVSALQWAIGLELFLMIEDPGRVFLTTDHPNGGPFTSYPHLMRLLGDRSFRQTAIAEIDPDAAAASQLQGMDREYSVEDFARCTRSGPAEILGLADRGHLRPGALADIVAIEQSGPLDSRFSQPKFVMRRGTILRRGGQVTGPEAGRPVPPNHQMVMADRDRLVDQVRSSGSLPILLDYHNRFSSVPLQHQWIGDDEFGAVLKTGVSTAGMNDTRLATKAPSL